MATHQTEQSKPAKLSAKDRNKSPPKVKGKEANLEVPPEAPTITEEQRQGERRGNVDAMAFALQQLSTPEAPPAPQAPTAAVEQFNKELVDLQKKYGVAIAPAVLKAPKADKLQSNGITRPGPGTITGKVWAAADAITAQQNGVVAAIASVKAHPLTHNINDHTIKTQYSRWRQYNGVKGRLPMLNPTPVPTVQGEDDGLTAAVH
jgi:hypothetical protein